MILSDHVRGLLRDAAEWRLLAMLFECPSDEWRSAIDALSSELHHAALREAVDAARTEAAEGLFHHVFGPGGPAPAREASYLDTLQLGYVIAELECYYNAFAYRHRVGEPADHIAVEAGFIGYLRFKEAYAIAEGESVSAAIAAEAARDFIKGHLSRVAEPLAALLEESGVTYLAIAGRELLTRVGPSQQLPVLNLAGAGGEDSCFECGSE